MLQVCMLLMLVFIHNVDNMYEYINYVAKKTFVSLNFVNIGPYKINLMIKCSRSTVLYVAYVQ